MNEILGIYTYFILEHVFISVFFQSVCDNIFIQTETTECNGVLRIPCISMAQMKRQLLSKIDYIYIKEFLICYEHGMNVLFHESERI
jgi:hypothetical protein